MLTVSYVISFVGMVVVPILLWFHFTRRLALPWKLVLAGALTFIASQVLHIPLVIGMNAVLQSQPLLVNAVILGLLAGVFEESARLLLFRYILRHVRAWKEGLLVGLGHGGVESVLLGILAAIGFATMVSYRTIDLATVPGIPADQLEVAKQQVEAYWSTPWYLAFLGFVERLFAICLHLSLSAMVLYAVVDGKPVWFWVALLWHAFVDAVAVYMVQQAGPLVTEGIIAVFAVVSLWIVFRMRSRFTQEDHNPPPLSSLTA